MKGHRGSVVCRPIDLLRIPEDKAPPFPCHGHNRRQDSHLFAPDWRQIEAASLDEKGVCLDGPAPAAAESRVVDQALSELCAVVDRVLQVVFLFEHRRLAVVISRQTQRAQCQDWLRAVRGDVDPGGYPSCRPLQILRPLLQSLLLRLRRPRPRLRSCSGTGGGHRAA